MVGEYYYLRSRYGYWAVKKDWVHHPNFEAVPKLYRDIEMAKNMVATLKRRTGLDVQIYTCTLEG